MTPPPPPTAPASLRVVHIIDAAAGDETILACAAAASIPLADHTIILLADSAAEQHTRALGLLTPDRVNPAGPVTHRRLAALLRARLDAESRPTVLTAWSVPALALARRALGKRSLPRVAVLPVHQAPTPADAYALDEVTILVLSTAVREAIAPAAAARRGSSPNLIRDNIRLAPPPVFTRSGPVPTSRESLRSALGLTPSDRVVSLLASPARHADALAMAFQLGLCFTIGHPLVGLVPRSAANLRQGLEFCREHGRRWNLLPFDLSLPELVAAADLCIAQSTDLAPSCGPTALSLAAAMGVPVAAHPSVLSGLGLIAPPPPALLAANSDRNALALPIISLAESSPEAAQLAHAQRAWCDHARAADAFRSTLAAIWAEVTNLPDHPHAPSHSARYATAVA